MFFSYLSSNYFFCHWVSLEDASLDFYSAQICFQTANSVLHFFNSSCKEVSEFLRHLIHFQTFYCLCLWDYDIMPYPCHRATFFFLIFTSFRMCCSLSFCIYKSKLATIVEGDPKAPFSIATTPRCRGGRYFFPGLLYFTLDLYLIMLSVKQGGIKYHFLSLWYDSTWDWTQVSRAIGEHSNCKANVLYIYIYIYIFVFLQHHFCFSGNSQ